MSFSKLCTFPCTKNKSKEFYCRCYVFKLILFLQFLLLIFLPCKCFSCITCHVKNYYDFLGSPHLFGDIFSFLRRTLYNTWKSHYRQVQVPVMIFNKKVLVNISSISKSRNPPWNLLSFVSKIFVNKCLKKVWTIVLV